MPGRLEGGGPFGPFRRLGRVPSARNPNPGQTPAPGSQPRENRKAKFSGGKGSVAQWLACASSDSTVIPVRDTNSKMACCLVRSLGSAIMCFSWSAFVYLSQSHHAGFANTHTGLKTLLWHNLPFIVVLACWFSYACPSHGFSRMSSNLRIWQSYPRVPQILKVLCPWYIWKY